uniref:Aspartic proteinase nepenthesin-1 n=1 Tax=Aegilops tauschii TaxID=37682 RepID=R7WB46_AEGTA
MKQGLMTAMSSVSQQLLLLLFCYYSAAARAEAVCAEQPATPSSSSGPTVPLNHRYGPCSPAPSTVEPTMAELLRADQLRAKYVRRKFSGTDGLQPLDLTVPADLGLALGTLHAAECTQLGNKGNGCSNSTCQYVIEYTNQPNNTGTYGSDTLMLSSSDTVENFQFGCRQDEAEVEDSMDGLMGLGGDVQSLVSQTEATYGKAYSYCLPPTNATSGFLTLGGPNDTSGFLSTPMIRWEQVPTFHGVLLQDIVVNGTQLNIPPSAFAAGSLVSSGAYITRLPPAAYTALKTAFKASMTQYKTMPARSILDTCFDFTGLELDSITVPDVALVFDGGAVGNPDRSGVVIGNCLAFAASTNPSGIPSVIGNVQQRTLEVLLNVGQSVVGFRPGAC